MALLAGEDGLRDIRQIVDVAAARLKPGGTLFMEIGHTQGDSAGGAGEELSHR